MQRRVYFDHIIVKAQMTPGSESATYREEKSKAEIRGQVTYWGQLNQKQRDKNSQTKNH